MVPYNYTLDDGHYKATKRLSTGDGSPAFLDIVSWKDDII